MSRPKLSVVVAAWNTPAHLHRCLTSLVEQCDASETELVVSCNYDGAGEMIRTEFPAVKFLRCPEATTVPVLRARGLIETAGEVVALLEDHCFVDKWWSVEIKKAHRLPYSAIGGSVENASTRRAIDWAVYFYDYGKYMLPGRSGTADSLPGNNVSYKRSALDAVQNRFRSGFFEAFVNWELKSSGAELYFVPSAIVYHGKSYAIAEAIADCYHHGRAFAGMRVSSAGMLKRAAHVLSSPLLPLLLPARIVFRTVRKGRNIKPLMRSLPQVLLLMASWSCGEFTGYLLGQGRSASRWA